MPIKVPDSLPAVDVLSNENIFLMKESAAVHQDIRPLKIAIMNLMPIKIATEIHLLRLLSNTPIQVDIDLLHTQTYKSKNTPEEHLDSFYKTFEKIKNQRYDGMIITGAPVEQMPFEEVAYWQEMENLMEWADAHVTSTLFICWAAQAGMYYHYGIPKYDLNEKMFGVFEHSVNNSKVPIVRGFDDTFLAPHSRHTEVRREDIVKVKELEIVSESPKAGIYIVADRSGKKLFVTGHSEYDPDTLKDEYERDAKKGLNIKVPENYFPLDNPSMSPLVRWRSHANLLFANWLNYYVYQVTPYDL